MSARSELGRPRSEPTRSPSRGHAGSARREGGHGSNLGGLRWSFAGILCLAALFATACGHRGVTPIRSHFNQGVYHYSKGAYDAAISEYRLALEEDAGDWRARFNLAEALEARATRLELGGEPEEAEALRREAEEHYVRILADDPGNLRASVNLAARERQRGDAGAG